MLRMVAMALAGALFTIVVLAATKPDTFRVERSTSIAAPPEKIYPLIADFDRWSVWSPWEKMDPAMKRSRSGAPSGKGSVYAWEGNNEVGKGRMEIIETQPPRSVTIQLDFERPFEAHNVVDFRLEPSAGATQVTWAMRGASNFLSKVVQVFASMDSMVGKDFEAGLANLKAAAEN